MLFIGHGILDGNKRTSEICGGYILWGISILGFALVTPSILSGLFPALAGTAIAALGVTLVIVLDCLMTFFGSSANDAAFNAWLTDATEEGGRGAVEGINAMMPLVAILVVFGGFMSFDLALEESWKIIFLIIGIAVLLTAVIGIFCIQDTIPEEKAEKEKEKSKKKTSSAAKKTTNAFNKTINSAANTIGREVGKKIVRGIFDTFFKG